MRKQEDIDKVIEQNSFYDFSEYDFSLKYDEKSKVICPKHGVLYRSFRDLKTSKVCIECNKEVYINPQREGTESYINKVNSKFHNNKIDWKGFQYPKMQHSIVNLKCTEHGIFETTPNKALNLRISPCPKCSADLRGVSEVGDVEAFIKKAMNKYGDKYSYEKVSFSRLADTVTIYCKIHKEYFDIIANNFLYSAKIGCPKCILENIKNTQRMTQEEFIRRCIETHDEGLFDLSNIELDGLSKKVEVKCNKCENIFFPLADNFSNGSGCPYCANMRRFNKWKDDPTRLYVIKLFNGLYKVGVTINTVKERYSRELNQDKYEVIYDELFSEGRLPFTIEQRVRSRLWEYNYSGESPFRITGTNELFTINPIDYIEEVKQEMEVSNGNTKRN